MKRENELIRRLEQRKVVSTRAQRKLRVMTLYMKFVF